jgi:RimJ/RimL family protein N-acetyltransferase/8-oxo-dGTP pyrophosphatase MutT (NUDIX family)
MNAPSARNGRGDGRTIDLGTEVTLRPVEDADLPVFFAHQRDRAARWMAAFTSDDPEDRAAFDAHWLRIRGDHSVTVRTVLCGREVAGHVAAFERDGTPEVTYWIGRGFWGRGIATQALRLLLDEVRTRPIDARVARDNAASIRVLERCGFVACGEERGFAAARGGEIEELIYRLGPARTSLERPLRTFGIRRPGVDYRLRPGAYAVATNASAAIAAVSTPSGLFLPGGGRLDGETPAQAVVREAREECGLRVRVVAPLGTVDELVDGPRPTRGWCKRCTFFMVEIVALDGGGEADHVLVWLSPEEATRRLQHAAHRWAVTRAAKPAPDGQERR